MKPNSQARQHYDQACALASKFDRIRADIDAHIKGAPQFKLESIGGGGRLALAVRDDGNLDIMLGSFRGYLTPCEIVDLQRWLEEVYG